MNRSPFHGGKIQAMDIVVPGSRETIPSTKSEKRILPNKGGQSRSSTESLASGGDGNGKVGFRIIFVKIIGIVKPIVSTNKPQSVIISNTFVFGFATH